MTEDSREPTRTAAALDDSLLDGKLAVPQPRPGFVSRRELIDAARVRAAGAVGITAAAGYGKTTLLAEWASVEDRRVGWVSFDRLDDDPGLMLVLIAHAYTTAFPEMEGLVDEVGGQGVSALGRAAPRLASILSRSSDPFVLILDDLNELRSPACHDVLGVVAGEIPEGSQLVTASRFEQPHLQRRRGSGDVMEFLSADLALDTIGAAQIFAAAHVPLSHDQATAVTTRTEGWPTGLHLAAIIARDTRDEGRTLTGDDRYVADYLYRESLSHLDEDTQRFLRRTAVLNQLSAPLCDAVLGERDSQARLRTLEASNAFLIPLDRRREWYRHHSLFGEFLLGELRRVEPEMIMKLHLRAADWYESNGSPTTALEHLLQTGERDRCAQLLSELVLPTSSAGQISTVQRWLSSIGDRAIEAYPPLAVLAGWITALAGQTAQAQRWATVADATSFDPVPVDGTASFESSRAMLRAAMCLDGPDQMMADANRAVDQEPPWSPWRDTALCLAAEALLLTGASARAQVVFEEATAAGLELGNTGAIVGSESELALLAMDRGQWDTAADRLDLALDTIEKNRMHDYAMSVLAFAAAARLAVHRGDMGEVDRQLTRAMRARPSCTAALPTLAVRGRLQLAKVYLVRGDSTTARHLMREIDDLILRRPALGVLLDDVSDLRATLTMRSAGGGAPPLTPAELRLLPYLQTHLTIGEIGERLFVSRNTVSTEVAAIYRKLGVSSRHDAVDRATAIGLLGE